MNSLRSSRARIIVLGYIVRGPMGGLVWHHLQYVMGLSKLGHDVYFLEDSGDSPWCCYDPSRHVTDSDPSYGLRFIDEAFHGVGAGDCWAYYDAHRGHWHGPVANRINEICRSADLILDISGINVIRPWFHPVPRRAVIDTDPVFTQLRHLTDPDAYRSAAMHTSFFSFGENIETGRANIPADGFAWRSTRQPVVLEAWPVMPGPTSGAFTTVMQWESYNSREYQGRHYGMKSDSFAQYLCLPAVAGPRFEVAISGKGSEILAANGWNVSNALELARYPQGYQQYIRRSKAEFTVAKHGYVSTRSGWFSERSAVYLASGRPVVAQDTGFSDWLPVGRGLHAFNTQEEACAAIRRIDAEYDSECRAARDIAADFFDSAKVLSALVENAFSSEPLNLESSREA
jgi:hypothetical protein